MPDPGSGPIARWMTDLAAWLSTVDASAWVSDPGAGDAPAGGLCAWPVAVLAEQEGRATNQRQPMRLRVGYEPLVPLQQDLFRMCEVKAKLPLHVRTFTCTA